MTREKHQGKKIRKQYSEEYKSEALALAERVGIAEAARQLGVHESQLYDLLSKVRCEQDQGEAQRQLVAENARLKRQLADQAEELAILKKAAAYFAKGLK